MTPTAASVSEVRLAVALAHNRGMTVGLVPTMGALHDGHATLIRAARAAADFVVVSIFVNPKQFGPHEDFHRYPRPLEADLALCGREGVDLAFVPDVAAMYPAGFRSFVEVADLQDVLEGATRPGHFRGVATVVLKLFNLVQPDFAFFGQKDAQQVRVIQQLVADLNVPVEVRVCPTARADDGLALSSRNVYLDAEQRRQAPALYATLRAGRARIEAGERDADALRRTMTETLAAGAPAAAPDYVEVVDGDTLRPVVGQLGGRVLLMLAARFGSTRLIDNEVVEV